MTQQWGPRVQSTQSTRAPAAPPTQLDAGALLCQASAHSDTRPLKAGCNRQAASGCDCAAVCAIGVQSRKFFLLTPLARGRLPDGVKIKGWNRKDRMDQEKEPGVALLCRGAGHSKITFVYREGLQEVPGHPRMRDMPSLIMMQLRHA
jgi:hypothetical protein